jgi:hypothetical protein
MSAILTSDFNLQRINTKEFADNLDATIDFGGNILAIARRGSGKTSIAKEAVRRSKRKEVYMNLAPMERPDIGGYPDFFGAKKGDKFINFLMTHLYKDLIEGDQSCVAILDEVDKADNSLFAPLLEFTQFRTINGYKLKNLHAIIMTGNLQAEGGIRPPLPLLDRTEKFIVEINAQHWLDWGAETREIHPSVSAYIADNLGDLCGDIDPGPDSYADTSPRGWHAASKLLYFGERKGWHPNMMMHKVSACVGKRVGNKYSTFFTYYQELLPTVEKIMRGEKVPEFTKYEPTKKLVVCMIMCARLAAELDKLGDKQKGTDKIELTEEVKFSSDNVAKFLIDIDPEQALISMRGQIGAKRVMDFSLYGNPHWDKLLEELVKRIEL